MPQSDIDKILADIKKRKERSQAAQTVKQSPQQTESAVAVAVRQKDPQPESAPQTHSRISEKDKAMLSRFINSSAEPEEKTAVLPVEDSELDAQFENPEYVSKKSEDYIDENFMKFFTQSVIVTKTPEETANLQVKRKKGGFFKRKYITDSLSLNIETLEEEEEKRNRKKARRKDEITKDMPIVKTAGDVYARTLEMEPVKEEITQETPVKDIPVKEESVKTVYKPKQERNSLSAVLGDDKDPESLAKRILRQRKQLQGEKQQEIIKDIPVKEEITKEIVKPAIEEKSQEDVKIYTPATEEKPQQLSDNPVINSIYTAVIEAQAQQALATDEMTGFIPEFPDEEEEETVVKETVQVIPEEDEEEEEVFEEYIVQSEFFDKSEDESTDIVEELIEFRQTLSMRMLVGFVCGGILAYLNMASASGWPVPGFIAPDAQPLLFYIACTLVYGIAFVCFLPTVLSGFTAVKNAPAPDTLVSLGAIMALVQLLVMVVFSSKIPAGVTIFAAFVCLTLAFNAMGKKIATSTIIKNLTLANVPDGINAGYIVNDTDAVKRLARTLDEKVPKILVSRKTGAITNFVQAGFSIHNSDYTARKLAVAGWAITLVCFVMGFVLSKDFVTAIFCAAGASALQIPLSQTLVNSVPSALMQKNLEKVGALVNGWQGIDQLSKTTHVNFDAKHLFPRGTVILHGIKTFEKERIDLAIIYAASVLIDRCDVMRPVFMEVIEGKTDILYPLDSCEYIERQGYVSWINNNRVIVGNRTLMEKYDVNMPPLSLEAKFTKQGRKPVYLAVGGKLFGMFVVSYRPDEIVKDNLDKLMEKGVSIILSSNDFNIDEHLLEEVYDIPVDMVSVLNQKEAALLTQFTEYAPESEACMAHLDSLASLVAGFCGAESAKSAESICSMIQIASVAIGAILALMFTWSQTIMHLPLLSVLLLSFGFMGLTMLAAFAKKY
ncbi:MAG: hypothetical protein IKJ05_06550 [Oscillospiraceae bacterium]|nr:hypothetical protein [Oscillospiraceae bacterium]